MNRNSTISSVLLAIVLTAGCKRNQPGTSSASATPYFQTTFQYESQFIVQEIVSDLAEQVFFAGSKRFPDQKQFSVVANEAVASLDTPVFDVQINFDKKTRLNFQLAIDGPIWSPAVYQKITDKLAQSAGLLPVKGATPGDTSLFSKLVDGTPETIEKENQRISAALQNDFKNPALHEEAAMVLGAFLLRDHAGRFFEIRSPLCRLTAHLAMAHFLRGGDAAGINGRMAETAMLVLVNDGGPAVEQLKAIGTNDSATASISRALYAFTTGDYRGLDQMKNRSQIEQVTWFKSRADYLGIHSTWLRLTDEQKKIIDFYRIANYLGYSVEIGHELLQGSMPLELQEITSIYQLARGKELAEGDLVRELNALPDRCLSSDSSGKVGVHVIGWGQWAWFLQRHLCHAIQQNFYFVNGMWGVHDQAQEFAKDCEQKFGGLLLYPFVRRYNSWEVEAYHKAVDDGYKVTVASPHLVPAECWNSLGYKVNFAPLYDPLPNPHVNEWHYHNPPPGTVYDLHPRLNHPSLVQRSDVLAKFEKLHQLAPCDGRVSGFIAKKKYNDHLTYEQATSLYQAVLPYSVTALKVVAFSVHDQSDRFEQLMLKAAELDPSCYYTLANHAQNKKLDDKAADYLEKGCSLDLDSIRVASYGIRRVHYFLQKGNISRAREIADDAGEVYSELGLQAKATFFEETTNYPAAFEWFAKVEERYQDAGPLVGFCIRYKALTGDKLFDPEVKKRMKTLFPRGLETVTLQDFRGPPKYGVFIKQENDLLKSIGLKASNVIVAIDGTRVYDMAQYQYVRDSKDVPELRLVVWQGDTYREFKASPPHRRFGVQFGSYIAQ